MSRKRQCTTCGEKHVPPTGKHCLHTVTEQEEEEEEEEAPWTQVLAAVQAMDSRIADIEHRMPAPGTQPTTTASGAAAAANATINSASTTETSHVTLEDLRRLEPLNLRVDNFLSTQASSSNLVTDVLALSLGGKLLKNPRSSTVRRIRNPVLWPHQFIHRSGTAELSFDVLSLPEFVAGTCSILQLQEIPQAEKEARLKHLHYLMLHARSYTWESIRSMYAAALEDIQYGHRSWQQPLSELKEQLLTIEHLATSTAVNKITTAGKQNAGKGADPCRLFNYANCTRSLCPHPHRCYVCWRFHKEEKSHPAKDCARRTEYMSKNGNSSAASSQGTAQ